MAEDLSRREVLENAMEAAMNNALEKVEEKSIEVAPVDDIAEEAKADRNEKGQFVAKEQQEEEPVKIQAEEAHAEEVIEEVDEDIPEPSSWKKEYRGLFNKVKGGENLSKDEGVSLLKYINQRDEEYKRGVRTYKEIADSSKSLQEAINPFIPELEANNISPAAWINNLGRAHMTLTKAPYDQKLAMFQQLAQEYGIQFGNNGNTLDYSADAVNQGLMQTIQSLQAEIQSVKGWKQQEEDSKFQSMIDSFAQDKENYPYFEELRPDMSRLLGAGMAKDLKGAYELAERTNADVWQRKQEKLLADATEKALKAQQVQKAKAASVSVKSVTPSGKINTPAKTDRRSLLADAIGEAMNTRI